MRITSSRKFLFALSICFLFPSFSPGYSYIIDQPSGYSFSARMYGSEYYSYIRTKDGYTIAASMHNDELWWFYARKDNGKIVASDILVDQRSSPPSFSYKIKPSQKKESAHRFTEQYHFEKSESKREERTVKPLVILVDFENNSPVPSHSYSREQFDALIFKKNLSPHLYSLPSGYEMSVRDYYSEVSDNQIIIEGSDESVVDWVTLPFDYSYYVDDAQGFGDGDGGIQKSSKAALVHALSLIDVDMTQFDGNGDGVCDMVIMVMEGWDSGSSNQFWSFKSHLWSGDANNIESSSPTMSNELQYDGIKIRNFIVTTEKIYHSDDSDDNYDQGDIRPIGTLCHEIGHILGLPDLYDTSESSAPGIGDWGLMGTGNWNNQVSPSSFSAWSSSRLGITEIEQLDNISSYYLAMQPVHSSRKVYRLNIGAEMAGEYILLENRSAIGTDSYLKGSGLLVWHIDERLTSTFPSYNDVNIYEDFYGVRLLEAGGTSDLSTNAGTISSSSSHVFDGTALIYIDDDTTPSLAGNSYDRDADGVVESSVLSDIQIEDIYMFGEHINLTISAPDISSRRVVHSENGIEGGVEQIDNFIPGVKYSPIEDEYLKIIQIPVLSSVYGDISGVEINIYDISSISLANVFNKIYSYSHDIQWSSISGRESGMIDIYTDTLQLTASSEYFIEIDYQGTGFIIPIEFGFYDELNLSGQSYYRNALGGQLLNCTDRDFVVNLTTSSTLEQLFDEDFVEIDVVYYPYPNPTTSQITLDLDGVSGDLDISIYNVLGEQVSAQLLEAYSYPAVLHYSLSNLPSGVYLVILKINDIIYRKHKISIIN